VPCASIELPAGFAVNHDKSKIGSDNPADFCTKQQYLELFDKVHATTLSPSYSTPTWTSRPQNDFAVDFRLSATS
jgi:hypothetical protein